MNQSELALFHLLAHQREELQEKINEQKKEFDEAVSDITNEYGSFYPHDPDLEALECVHEGDLERKVRAHAKELLVFPKGMLAQELAEGNFNRVARYEHLSECYHRLYLENSGKHSPETRARIKKLEHQQEAIKAELHQQYEKGVEELRRVRMSQAPARRRGPTP